MANLWVDVQYAGYSLRSELLILLAVFIVPFAFAAAMIWHFSRTG